MYWLRTSRCPLTTFIQLTKSRGKLKPDGAYVLVMHGFHGECAQCLKAALRRHSEFWVMTGCCNQGNTQHPFGKSAAGQTHTADLSCYLAPCCFLRLMKIWLLCFWFLCSRHHEWRLSAKHPVRLDPITFHHSKQNRSIEWVVNKGRLFHKTFRFYFNIDKEK